MEKLEEQKKIKIVCNGLEGLTLSSLTDFLKSMFVAIQAIDAFLLFCLDVSVICKHKIDQNSYFKELVINYQLISDSGNDEKSHNILADYLTKGKHAIFTADYNSNDSVDNIIRLITEYSIEVDELINTQQYLYNTKFINRVALTKVIEKVTHIKDISDNGIICTIDTTNNKYDVKSFVKRKALELMGGKYVDEKPYIGNFLLSKLPFGNIEKRSEFLLDGNPVTVFITDKNWINKFNANTIPLSKDDRFKVKALVERSPLTNKSVIFYFTEIVGKNI